MRYVIVGVGAIGGVLAARLAQHSPHPPVAVARGDNAGAIRTNGMLLRSPDETATVAIEVAASPAELELHDDDVLVFTTKTHQVQQALLEWVDRPVHDASGAVMGTAGELLPAVMALNGVTSERMALRLFARVYGVCVWLPAVHLAPGEFAVRIAPVSGVFIAGRYAAAADERDAALLGTLEADWEAASFEVHVVDDVMRWKHSKLLGNLGNAVQALAGPAVDAHEVLDAVRDEAAAVLRHAGIPTATAEEEKVWRGEHFRVRPVPGLDRELGGSSWQSLERGTGSIETDYLNGEIALIARLSGGDAPFNEALQRLARRAAAERLRPGSMTAAELRAAVLGS